MTGDNAAKLIKLLPDGSFIKPHPSFTCSAVFDKFKLIFDNINNKNIKLLHSNINLELEMLFEKHYWTKSSLHIYALAFGSTYQKINLF